MCIIFIVKLLLLLLLSIDAASGCTSPPCSGCCCCGSTSGGFSLITIMSLMDMNYKYQRDRVFTVCKIWLVHTSVVLLCFLNCLYAYTVLLRVRNWGPKQILPHDFPQHHKWWTLPECSKLYQTTMLKTVCLARPCFLRPFCRYTMDAMHFV